MCVLRVGAGIQVPPNASRILAKWGLLGDLNKVSVTPHAIRRRRYSNGKVLNEQPLIPVMAARYGSPYYNVHHADYHNILVNKCYALSVNVALNAQVISADFSASSITLASREKLSAHLIIGADGLKSTLRSLFLGRPSSPDPTGDLAYRILISADKIRADPDLKEFVEKPTINGWIGPRAHAVTYLLRGGEFYNVVLCCPDNLPVDVNVAPAEPGEVEDFFAAWDPRLRKMVVLLHDVSKWRLQHSRAMEEWVHPAGKFALLGDSCHSTLPYLASGAAMAVEDGAVLGVLRGKLRRKDQLGDLLHLYEALRKMRTERVVRASARVGQMYHLEDGEAQQRRDAVMLVNTFTVAQGLPSRRRDSQFMDWLYGYDAFGEAEKGWQRYMREGRFWERDELRARL